jgi:signal transduction histidine kinase
MTDRSGEGAPPTQAFRADIMVVDDTAANLRLMARMLAGQGYKVRPVPSGALALQAARRQPPDLFLLDVAMPEMNGYEVCQALKADADLRDIPVIFVSALTDSVDKVRAFEAGGVDYVTKPFHLEEVMARMEAHLKLRELQAKLEDNLALLAEQNERLIQLEGLRDNLTHMIVHDLRSPLTSIMGSIQLLRMDAADRLEPESVQDVETALSGCRRLSRLINTLLDVTRLEAGEMPLRLAQVDLAEAGRAALGSLAGLTRDREVNVEIPEGPLPVWCDAEVVERIIVNLLGNALKFTSRRDAVGIRIERVGDRARVAVSDQGPGVPPEYHERIFEKFGQVEADARVSTGLGLTFCKLAVEALGGTIGLQSEVGAGSTFWFELNALP